MKPSALAALLFLMGCTAAAPKGPVSPAVPAPLPAPGPAPQGPAAAPAPSFDESALRGREFLLEASRSEIPVRDPVLGPLEEQTEILRVVDEFFHEVAGGAVSKTRLVERWSAYLQAWAARQKQQGFAFDSVRVGKSREDNGQWMVPVRLLSKDKPYQGWVFLVREKAAIQISDVRLEPAVPDSGPFDPEASAQEISNPIRR